MSDALVVQTDESVVTVTEALTPEIIPPIVVAGQGQGAWGDQSFHNLKDGAKASGMVLSAHELLGPADLNWDPEFLPLYAGNPGSQTLVNAQIGTAVVRSDTKQAIGIGGRKYTLLPHRSLADLADALVTKGLSFGNAGHKENGARPFIQLGGKVRTIGSDIKGNSVDIKEMITLLTSHDGTLKAMAVYSACVILCDNTYAHALQYAKGKGLAIRHTKSGPETLKEAISIAEMAQEAGLSFNNAALKLLNTPFNDGAMAQLATALISGEGTRSRNQRTELMNAWVSAPAAAPGTMWGAAQAVTYYTSHVIGTRNDTDRVFGLQTGIGNGAALQEKAWWLLNTDAGLAELAEVKALAA